MNPYRFDRIPLANRALLPDRPGLYAVFNGNFRSLLQLSLSAIVLAVLATEAPPLMEDLRFIWQEREQLIDAVGQWDGLKDRSQE